ncbi:lytic murein transglycosylase [Limoniibacter endophyticus]|uniref:Lytic transglycosylase n=1 Tax=Limoniibacter endophyticus TaxID=1565040 RepID=A0A8J3GHI1_9HYPH|nr:lytic murein transglycosylase [Limoniibacter endophyticus]GHC75104.1 lytic transglycosylase [Limoniibacter endophyticus]
MFLRSISVALALFGATSAYAQTCGGDFSQWKARIAAEAQAAGVGQRGLSALQNASIDQNVLKRDRSKSFFSQTFSEFYGKVISKGRVDIGRQKLRQHAAIFAKAERDYGVPGPVITAFWGLETDYGGYMGDFDTLNALVTLAHDCRRPELFRPQIVPLLTLMDRGVLPVGLKGAWAGEVGQTQILPSDYLARGVDGDGDGRVDLINSVPDVILTTANKLKSRGWRAGEPWIVEVKIPEELPWHETGRSKKLPVTQWAQWGIVNRDGSALKHTNLQAGLVLPMGRKGPAFLAFANYDVYLEWNQSFIYTLTAAEFATRLAGAPQFDRGNPEPSVTGEAMMALQRKLQARGHDVGDIDGILGAGTREAVRKEQDRLGLPVDGWPTKEFVARL